MDRSKQEKARLEKIYLESRAEILEAVGEQPTMRSTLPPAPFLPVGRFRSANESVACG